MSATLSRNVEANKACITIDSACDLPRSFINKHAIRVLPIKLKLGNTTFVDTRDPAQTIKMYSSQRLHQNYIAKSEAASVSEISSIFENDIAPQYDNVLAITISSKRSEIYKNVKESVFVGCDRFKSARKKQGNSSPLRIQVVDSQALFPGQGLLAYEAVRLLKAGIPVPKIAAHIEKVKNTVKGFLLPENLYYLNKRASIKGDKSVSWLSYKIGSMMDIKPIIEAQHGETFTSGKAKGFEDGLKQIFQRANSAIESGLTINAINMSYAGNPKVIENNRDYQMFINDAKARGVKTLLSVMSTTAAVNVGPGAFSLAFAEK
ncbi:DegV family protein [Aurantivibrio plasticivorans]